MCSNTSPLEWCSNKDGLVFSVDKEVVPLFAIVFDQGCIGENDRLIVMIPRESADKSLQNGVHFRFLGETLVKNAQMILVQGLRAAQLFFDKDKGMFQRFDKKNLVKNDIKVGFGKEFRVRKDLLEVENGKVVETGMRGANDVIFRIFEERRDFPNAIKDKRIHGIIGRTFPIEFGIVLAVDGATQVFVFENASLVEKIERGDIGGVVFHLYDRSEMTLYEIVCVIGRGSEMNDANLFLDKIREFHELRSNK